MPMNYVYTRVGTMLKDARVGKGYTQMELAAQLGYTSPQFVSNWERGQCSAPGDQFDTLEAVLKVPAKKLIDAAVEDYRDTLKAKVKGRRK